MSLIRVLLADDHPPVCTSVRRQLACEPDMRVVGEAHTGRAVIADVARLPSTVVLLDLHFPDIPGLEVIREIVAQHPQVGIIIRTRCPDESSFFQAIQYGARGYLFQDTELAELLRAIRVVARGEAAIAPCLTAA